mmetsp:Transcript_24669/g.53217  ORF Transcript_24669/g.53217 Transcript_24669/m.53217 type:complete len:233 (+) Transcript_24669:118-816(+)
MLVQSDGGGSNPFNLSSASDASCANSHIFSSCKHDLKIAILTTQCFPAARSMTPTLLPRPFSLMVLTLIKQCSYVAEAFPFAAWTTPAFATSRAARSLPSRHSATNSTRSFLILSFLSGAVSLEVSLSSAISPHSHSIERFINRRDFLDPSLGGTGTDERDLFFFFEDFLLPSVYSSSEEGSSSSSLPLSLLLERCRPQAMSLEPCSSEMVINPNERRRALFFSMFLARACS